MTSVRRRADLVRVAEVLRGLADQIDQRGDHAWTLTREWTAGPRASTLETGRSRTLGDPTGRAAIADEVDPHAAMLTTLDRLMRNALDLAALYRDTGPDPRARCRWHATAGYHAPATRIAAGQPVCDWCYRRHADLGRPPTTTELDQRASGAHRIRRTRP